MIFYKYCSINNYTLYNLSTNSLYCAKPEELNDPYDSSIIAKFDHFTNEQLIEYLKNKKGDYQVLSKYINSFPDDDQKIRELVPHVFAKELLDGIGICSLTKNFNNPLMWAHYASNYKGICIGYNTVSENKNDYIVTDTYDKIKIDRVIYQKTNGRNTIYPNMKKSISNRKLLLYKNKNWKYENEYRIVIKKELFSSIFLLENSIPEITFGINTNYIDQNIVKSLTGKYNKNTVYYKIVVGNDGLEREILT